MKCPTCGKEFSDGVCEIHREWCKDQPKEEKRATVIVKDKAIDAEQFVKDIEPKANRTGSASRGKR